jgi:phenylacetate-CoA ligase
MLPPLSPVIVRNVIYPVYRGFRGDRLLSVLAELENNQWLSREEIEDIQWRRMADLLKSVSVHVPYYRDIFAKLGLKAEDIRKPDDFLRLPLLDKAIIRDEGNRMVTADPMRKGLKSSSGGSTGEPLYFSVDLASGPVRRANTQRAFRMAGVDIGAKQAYIWGLSPDQPLKKRAGDAVKNYFNNVMYISSFNMSEENLRSYAARLRKYRPDLVIGYPSAITFFAEYMRDNRIDWMKPRAVVSSGEKLYPKQREILEETFGCGVFDRYGCREFANVAHECDRHNGLHVFADINYLEVVHESGRPAEPGEIGEIVVTDLFNYYMPFIRYRTGDLAVPSSRTCECGRGLPLLDKIQGRTFENIITPDGRSVGGYFWTHLSRTVPGIKKFQVEQKQRNRIVFRVVPGPAWKDDYAEKLERSIRENVGETMNVKVEKVGEIPLSPAGKFRFIVSKIEERKVIKSKIHKARVTAALPGHIDCVIVDEELLELSDMAPCEKVLIVDITNGARVETFLMKATRGSGELAVCGDVSRHIAIGDDVTIMAFTWSDSLEGKFTNILVDEKNKFIRYLTEKAGDIL